MKQNSIKTVASRFCFDSRLSRINQRIWNASEVFERKMLKLDCFRLEFACVTDLKSFSCRNSSVFLNFIIYWVFFVTLVTSRKEMLTISITSLSTLCFFVLCLLYLCPTFFFFSFLLHFLAVSNFLFLYNMGFIHISLMLTPKFLVVNYFNKAASEILSLFSMLKLEQN